MLSFILLLNKMTVCYGWILGRPLTSKLGFHTEATSAVSTRGSFNPQPVGMLSSKRVTCTYPLHGSSGNNNDKDEDNYYYTAKDLFDQRNDNGMINEIVAVTKEERMYQDALEALDDAKGQWRNARLELKKATTRLQEWKDENGDNNDKYLKLKKDVFEATQVMKVTNQVVANANQLVNDAYQRLNDARERAEKPTEDMVTQEVDTTLYKRKRWEALNIMIQQHRKSKLARQRVGGGGTSLLYSDVEWRDVEPVLRSILKPLDLHPSILPDLEIDALYLNLAGITKAFGHDVLSGSETKRLFFIAPILVCVSNLFGDARLLVEESVDGRQVQTNGYFDFVICRGKKRLCIVEAKKDDMDQGKAQNLLGCEALSNVEQLPVVYGIVTNYAEWFFYRSETTFIYEHQTTLEIGMRGKPTRAGLQKIAGMIYKLLDE